MRPYKLMDTLFLLPSNYIVDLTILSKIVRRVRCWLKMASPFAPKYLPVPPVMTSGALSHEYAIAI